MKRMFTAFGLSAVLLIAALPAFAHEDHCMEVGGNINDAGQCIQAGSLEISSDYPIDAAHVSDALAAGIDEYINGSFDEFVGLFAEGFVPSVAFPWTLNIENDVLDGVSTVSVVFTRYMFTGGANGNTDYHTLTAVVGPGNLLTLPDIFVAGVDPYAILQPLAVAALTEQLGDAAVPEMLAEGTAPVPENYQNWALTADSLNLYFNEYQVAPGVAGAPSISIPLTELADVLQPQFLPA
ncbi:MAG: DUF3298 domain-containing protein [Anaerolineae bacterium]|nr:DUF3298 domain-containing protein [Anaerolineae bacterium]